ncbi:putative peroxiredoxin Rv2521/MT2597 [Arthrobacter sp. Hiyo6]|nr:putative peroxiredoxin Rv2521/MT2597 [Arthrobacter sp. Hiyo6]
MNKLARFAEKEGLTFPLLSDEDHAVAEAYAAWGEKKNYGKTYDGLIRSTVVVDADGNVALAQYNVRATGHVAKLRRDLGLAPSQGPLLDSARELTSPGPGGRCRSLPPAEGRGGRYNGPGIRRRTFSAMHFPHAQHRGR